MKADVCDHCRAVLSRKHLWMTVWKTDAEPLSVGLDFCDEACAARWFRVRAGGSQIFEPKVCQRRRQFTPALANEVAALYRESHAAGLPPTLAVAERFGVSHRTATRWVSETRKAGIMGAAMGTRSGEAR